MQVRPLFDIAPEGLFFGRTDLIERLCRLARDPSRRSPAIILKGSRWTGKTEILRRVHRDLFWNQGAVAPVYYQFRPMARVEEFAGDFIKEVIKQFLAFRRRDPELVSTQLTLKRLRLMLSDEGFSEAAGLITSHFEAREGGEPMALLRNALAASEVISRLTSSPAFLLLDDMDNTGWIRLYEGGPSVMGEVATALGSSSVVASAGANVTERKLASLVCSEVIDIDGLPGHDARAMIEELARGYDLPMDAQVVITAARRLSGNPFYIREIIRAASLGGNTGALKTLKGFASLYVREITTGALGVALAGEFADLGQTALRVMRAAMNSGGPIALRELATTIGAGRVEMERAVERLEALDLVRENLGSIVSVADQVVRDYMAYMSFTGLLGKSPEEARTWMIRDVIKSGHLAVAEDVKGRFRREVQAALEAFDGQEVPLEFFHVGSEHGETGTEEVLVLPSVCGCFGASAFEKYESGLPVLMAHGFAPGRFDASAEVLWIVGLKGTDTPLNTGDVDNFLRRSRILQREFCPVRVVRWLVARAGFTVEAMRRLEREGPGRGGVLTSDSAALAGIRKLARPLGVVIEEEGEESPVKEFEVVLPAGRNAELIGARAADEISSWMGFDEDSIGKIKTSVVEACINAFEHSGSPGAKVRLRFIAAPDVLTIYVSNPGLDFDGVVARGPGGRAEGGLPHKRGWGLELMRGLMDEVRYESIEGGTRLVLVKYLRRKEEGDDGERDNDI